ncbi:MAG: carbamoyl-phosphate synthase large subunit, partial [Luminiphilus sp.]|nr:carbamoyl-phosphate synthase large subunit [Luminiphilus sp.]
LDELANDITGGVTPASFEPAIDYVVTKVPRFAFEKFATADARLTTQMKSVGEVMAIGRTFQESMQKALRGLEVGSAGFEPRLVVIDNDSRVELIKQLTHPGADRIWYLADAFRADLSLEEIYGYSGVDPWFLVQIEDIVRCEESLQGCSLDALTYDDLRVLKRKGFSDKRIAAVLEVSEHAVRDRRHRLNLRPVYKRVDTCAAEFSSATAYMYSTYEEECEAAPSDREKIIVLGGGPNRIGQGIEFDYCCVHAAQAMAEDGYETIMINCNPETVSTDYDTSDRLFFEPVTLEDVLEIVDLEKPKGVIVQFGGQTPLKLARALESAGVPIIGTTPDQIDRAEDRERFQKMIQALDLLQPANTTVRSVDAAVVAAQDIGFPLVVRPSYVLGGRAMEVVYRNEDLLRYMRDAVQVSDDAPVLLDSFLSAAIEVDIDAVSDGEQVVIGSIMQHIEQAGIHSGDSACSLPPYSLPADVQDEMRDIVKAMAIELEVKGLMNVQLAWQADEIFVIEVNPRASRTVPFVSKAIGVSLAKIAARCMAGQSLQAQGFTTEVVPSYFSVKEAVLPFNKFPGIDPILGPEMKSTGEVMGTGLTFADAFAKAQLGAGDVTPQSGLALFSVRDADKAAAIDVAKRLVDTGFTLAATKGTAAALKEAGLEVRLVNKVAEGRPHIVDLIKNDEASLIINTTEGRTAILDSASIRSSAEQHQVFYTTTLAAADAICMSLEREPDGQVRRLQDLHVSLANE